MGPTQLPQNQLKFEDVINEKKLSCKNIPHDKMLKYISSKYPTSVSALQLRDTLNRFRLVGPLSQIILCNALQKTKVDHSNGYIVETDDNGNTNDSKLWWKSYYNKHGLRPQMHLEQNEQLPSFSPVDAFCNTTAHTQWNYLETVLMSKQPGHISPRIIIGIIVRDPRKLLPLKKGSFQIPDTFSDGSEDISMIKGKFPHLAESPLWDVKIRDKVTLSKSPDYKINEMRSKLLTPGISILPLDDEESRIPIILVHQRGENGTGTFGDGWDIIIPAGWGMPFWMNFVYRGARVVGQKELMNNTLEMIKFPPLKNAPDSLAGKCEMMREAEILRMVHFSHPPDKRPNFIKLRSASPFLQPWNVLIDNWSEKTSATHENVIFNKDDNSFYVLRDSLILNKIALVLKNSIAAAKSELKTITIKDQLALLPVTVDVLGKGTLVPSTMITWPSDEDLIALINFKKSSMNKVENSEMRPQEELQLENKVLRKQLKSKHVSEQKNLKRKCKCLKQKIMLLKSSISTDANNINSENNKYLQHIKISSESLRDLQHIRKEKNESYNSKMRSLWGLEFSDIKNVRLSCSRQILGYVNFGGESLRFGSKAVGLGYVSLNGILKYLNHYFSKEEQIAKLKNITGKGRIPVLLRSPDSIHYSYGLMTVLVGNE